MPKQDTAKPAINFRQTLLQTFHEMAREKDPAFFDALCNTQNFNPEIFRNPNCLTDPKLIPDDILESMATMGFKCLVFDLEATRRENTHLRKMLEDQSNEGPSNE